MKESVYAKPFLQAAVEVNKGSAAKLRELAEGYYTGFLDRTLGAVVACHNELAQDPSQRLIVKRVRDKDLVYGVGFLVCRVGATTQTGKGDEPVCDRLTPLLDLRLRKEEAGFAIVSLRHNDQGEISTYEKLMVRNDEQIPFLSNSEQLNFLEIVDRVLSGEMRLSERGAVPVSETPMVAPSL